MKQYVLMTLVVMTCHWHVIRAQQPVRPPLRYEIVEETRAQTFVADIKTDARLDQRHPLDVVHTLRLALLSRDSAVDYFTLDPTDGVLRTARVIDREAICKHDVIDCDISLEVAVSPRQYFESFKVCAEYCI